MTTLYRVALYNEDGDFLEEDMQSEYYVAAHLTSFNHDSTYPQIQGWIERSLDGGETWETYLADEFINGRPAWVEHQEIWRNKDILS